MIWLFSKLNNFPFLFTSFELPTNLRGGCSKEMISRLSFEKNYVELFLRKSSSKKTLNQWVYEHDGSNKILRDISIFMRQIREIFPARGNFHDLWLDCFNTSGLKVLLFMRFDYFKCSSTKTVLTNLNIEKSTLLINSILTKNSKV